MKVIFDSKSECDAFGGAVSKLTVGLEDASHVALRLARQSGDASLIQLATQLAELSSTTVQVARHISTSVVR